MTTDSINSIIVYINPKDLSLIKQCSLMDELMSRLADTIDTLLSEIE